MSKYRLPSENSKYYIPKEDYLTAIHYSLRYPLLKEEVESMADTSKAIAYDKDKVQSSLTMTAQWRLQSRLQSLTNSIRCR